MHGLYLKQADGQWQHHALIRHQVRRKVGAGKMRLQQCVGLHMRVRPLGAVHRQLRMDQDFANSIILACTISSTI